MKIKALQAFVIRDSSTGNLTSIGYGYIVEVDNTLGASLIADGLAEEYADGALSYSHVTLDIVASEEEQVKWREAWQGSSYIIYGVKHVVNSLDDLLTAEMFNATNIATRDQTRNIECIILSDDGVEFSVTQGVILEHSGDVTVSGETATIHGSCYLKFGTAE